MFARLTIEILMQSMKKNQQTANYVISLKVDSSRVKYLINIAKCDVVPN